jgi:hypothetical protein
VKLHRLYFWSSRRKEMDRVQGEEGLFARVAVAMPARHPPLGARRLHLPGGAVLEWEGAADLALIDRRLGR